MSTIHKPCTLGQQSLRNRWCAVQLSQGREDSSLLPAAATDLCGGAPALPFLPSAPTTASRDRVTRPCLDPTGRTITRGHSCGTDRRASRSVRAAAVLWQHAAAPHQPSARHRVLESLALRASPSAEATASLADVVGREAVRVSAAASATETEVAAEGDFATVHTLHTLRKPDFDGCSRNPAGFASEKLRIDTPQRRRGIMCAPSVT